MREANVIILGKTGVGKTTVASQLMLVKGLIGKKKRRKLVRLQRSEPVLLDKPWHAFVLDCPSKEVENSETTKSFAVQGDSKLFHFFDTPALNFSQTISVLPLADIALIVLSALDFPQSNF